MKSYMAIDQYGTTYHDLKHPRKELLKKFGRSHADKMFVEFKNGEDRWIGYVIAGHWLRLFEVAPLGDNNGTKSDTKTS